MVTFIRLTNVRVDATLNTDEDSPVKITDVTNNKDYKSAFAHKLIKTNLIFQFQSLGRQRPQQCTTIDCHELEGTENKISFSVYKYLFSAALH